MAIAPQRTAQGAPSVRVEPGAHATAGQVATLRVHVRNVTAAPQDVLLRVIGLESGWLPAPVPVPALPAGATASVELPLAPPAGVAPGDYPCVVAVAASAGGAPATTLVDATLRVDGASELVLSVEPADSRAVRARRLQVVLANTGSTPTEVQLEGRADPEHGLRVEVESRLVRIAPHETVRLPGRVRAVRPRLVGPQRRAPFRVTATGSRAPQRFDGTVTLRPLFTPTALRVLAVVAVIGLWAGAVLAALPWLSDRLDPARQPVVAEEQVSPPAGGDEGTGSGEGSGSGSDDGAGDGAGGGTGSGTSDGAGAQPGVRVAGVVTGAEPGGVEVQVVPAAALASDATGDAVSGASSGSGTAPTAAAAPVRGAAEDGRAQGLVTAARTVGALASPLALVRAVVPRLLGALPGPGGGSDGGSAGKVSGLALPVERTAEAAQRRSTVTSDDGTWAFGGLSATGRYLIVLSKPGYQTQRFLVTGAEAAATPLELEMVPGEGHMSGTVTGPDGPVGGVEVTLSDGTTTVTTRTATAGQVGHWEVDGLSTPSTYLVSAGSDQLGAQSTLVRLDAAGVRSVDLRLQRGVATLSGTVRGTDSLGGMGGLGGLTVTATAGDLVRTATTVTGDRSGTFVLPDLPVPAAYTLTIEGDGYATQTWQIDLTAAGSAPLDITMTSTGGAVEGTAVDESGDGLAGAGLTLTGPAGVYKTMSASDATGSFRLSGIAPGDYVLTAEVFGHESASAQVTVTSGATAQVPLTLPAIPGDGLQATALVRGRVTDASTGGQVTCPGLLSSEKCEVTVTTRVTDADGTARDIEVTSEPDLPYLLPAPGSPGLYPGRYQLTVTVPGYEPGHVDVAVAMGEVAEAATVALLPSPSIVGSVGTRVGPLPAGVCVVALPAGSPAPGTDPCDPDPADATRCVSDEGRCAYVGANGGYTIERLASGPYDVYVLPPASSTYLPPDRGTVVLTPGDVRRFDATLDRLGVLNLTVLVSDGGGTVLPGAHAVVTLTPVTGGAPVPEQQADDDGFLQVTGLVRGSYRVDARAADGTGAATLPAISVSENQEVSSQIVLTRAVGSISSKVVTQLASVSETPVEGATVRVSGVVRYNGLTPIRSEATATTDGTGAFTICTVRADCDVPLSDPDPPNYLPLVEGRVDIRVTAPGYVSYVATDVPSAGLAPITLSPQGVPFVGRVVLDPEPTDAGSLYEQVRFDVLSAPPGVGQISLTSDDQGNVTWSDASQPANPSGTGRMIRPGTYTVVATLNGYDQATLTLVVRPGEDMSLRSPTDPDTTRRPVVFTLERFGFLRIQARAAQDGAPVMGSVMTLSLPGGVTQRLSAHPGDDFIDFGDLPSGRYSVDVRAPGYQPRTAEVTLAPGQLALTPSPVDVVRLGTVHGQVRTELMTGWTQAVPGARVSVEKVPSTGAPFAGSTNEQGTFRITGDTVTAGLDQGTWRVRAEADGHNGNPSVDVVVPNPSDVAGLDVDAGTLLVTPVLRTLLVKVVDGSTGVPGLNLRLTYSDGVAEHALDLQPSCVAGTADTACADDEAGLYRFVGLLPLTYNLSISGAGYQPLALPATVTSLQDATLTVPITSPSGSVQGTVRVLRAGGATVPAGGAEVTLTPVAPTSGEPRTVTADETTGDFRLDAVPSGSYTLSATDGTLTVQRSLFVQPGQGVVVDLLLQAATGQVRVEVTATNGTDLTGALVQLSRSGGEQYAAQPVVRSGTSTYTTTFSQVATGQWDVTLSGPSGHLGTYTTTVDVTGTATATAELDVRERQLRLRAASAEAGAPSTVRVTLTPEDGDATTVTAAVGGGDTVVYADASDDVDVTATVSGDWTVAVSPATVAGCAAAGACDPAVVTLTVSPQVHDTETTLAADRTTVEVGDEVTFTATVEPDGGSGTVTGGSLVLQRRVGGSWQDVHSWSVDGSGLTFAADTSDWGVGAHRLRASYAGATSWAPSTSAEVTITVQEVATTTTLTYDEDAAQLVATVGPAAATGTVRFFTGTGGGATTVTGCGSVAVTAGTATCDVAQQATDTTVRATFTGTGVYADSGPVSTTVPAAPEEPADGGSGSGADGGEEPTGP